MSTYAGVYEIRNIANEHRYIGSSINISKRLSAHIRALKKNRHQNRYLQFAFNKYGKENFIFSPILYCDSNNTLLFEQMCFDELHPQYNFGKTAAAPMLNVKLTEEQINKMSRALKGNKHSEEHKRKISEAQKGKPRIGHPHTKATKRKISRAHMGKSYGPLSEEHKQKIKYATLGRICSDETKQRMSASAKLRWAKKRGDA